MKQLAEKIVGSMSNPFKLLSFYLEGYKIRSMSICLANCPSRM